MESKIQLVTVVAEGDVTRSDVEAYIAMSSGANVLEWRKLFDARKGRAIFTEEDVNALGVRIREGAAVRVVGPLAFVLPEIETPQARATRWQPPRHAAARPPPRPRVG